LPSGTWFAVMLSEGWMLALWTIGLASATRYIATGHRLWLVMTGAGIVALYATKAANGAVLVAALVVIGAGAFTLGARNRGRFAKLGIVAASLGIGQVLLTATLGLPGLQGTLQDLFTAHYTQPDVDNLLGRLVSRDLAVIGSLAGDTLRDPFLVVVALLLLVPLALRRATWAWMWLLAGMATCLTVAVHPITTEVPRLLAPIWVSAAMGGAVGVAWLSRRLQVAAQRPGDDVSADGTRLRDPRVEHAGD